MKTLLASFGVLVGFVSLMPAQGIGERSETVKVGLEKALVKRAPDITAKDLATVQNLNLPHIHLVAFHDGDFEGLTSLKRLHMFSLFHRVNKRIDMEPPPFNSKVFAKLASLEELIIRDDQLGSKLPDDVFTGLTSLKVLELSNVVLPKLPKSMLTLPRIETIYYDGKGMNKDDYAILQQTLGAKLKAKR